MKKVLKILAIIPCIILGVKLLLIAGDMNADTFLKFLLKALIIVLSFISMHKGIDYLMDGIDIFIDNIIDYHLEIYAEILAYHEAGHILASKYLDILVPNLSVQLGKKSIVSKICDKIIRKEEFLNVLVVLLAGREAEKLKLGNNSSLCEDDLEEANNIARNMVTLWGMEDNLISLCSFEINEIAPDISNKISHQVEVLLRNAEKEAQKIIKEHQEEFDEIAQHLLEEGKLSTEELDKIMKK